MKILIAYDSGNGTVKTAVDRMIQPLKALDVTVVSLNENQPNPNAYDIVVIGGSVRFGKLRKTAAKYLREHESILAQKKLGLFFCCGLIEEQDYYAEKLFSPALRNAAFHLAFFGGSLNTYGLSFWDKMMVRSMRSSLFEKEMDDGNYIPKLPYILPENIDGMARMILEVANKHLTP